MEIYKGRGKKEYTKQLIEVLDDVFFFDDEETPRRDFMSLLPKLYKDKYEPAYNNLVVMEGEDIKAAIGLYPLKFVAAGRELKCSSWALKSMRSWLRTVKATASGSMTAR